MALPAVWEGKAATSVSCFKSPSSLYLHTVLLPVKGRHHSLPVSPAVSSRPHCLPATARCLPLPHCGAHTRPFCISHRKMAWQTSLQQYSLLPTQHLSDIRRPMVTGLSPPPVLHFAPRTAFDELLCLYHLAWQAGHL